MPSPQEIAGYFCVWKSLSSCSLPWICPDLYQFYGAVQKLVSEQLRYQIRCPELPLAVYREIAAHLRQVKGIDVGLIPQTLQQFDYNQSQIGGLWIQYGDGTDSVERERVSQILAYYQNRYGAWEKVTSPLLS